MRYKTTYQFSDKSMRFEEEINDIGEEIERRFSKNKDYNITNENNRTKNNSNKPAQCATCNF